MASLSLIKALAVTAEVYGREFSEAAARVMASDLADYPESSVLAALAACRRQLSRFPSISDILARIDDGRPGVEEAWAMIPQDESQSVVWTTEMQAAFGLVRELLEQDPIAARMSFREVYLRLITEARAEKKPAVWQPSLGHDRTTHELVLKAAVARGRLTQDHAQALLPERPVVRLELLRSTGEGQPPSAEIQTHLAKIRAFLEKPAGEL